MLLPSDANPNQGIYAQRRARLIESLREGVVVVPTAPECVRNGDAHYAYRYDSYFYYLTGFQEPEAVLAIIGGREPRSVLFCRERDPEREIWDGYRYGCAAARTAFGFDECHPISELDALMPELLANQPALHCHLGDDARWDARVFSWLNALRARARSGVRAPDAIRDVRAAISEMRVCKDRHEIAAMRRAGAIAVAAHRRAMRATRPVSGVEMT